MLNQWLYHTIQYREPNSKSRGGNHPLDSRCHKISVGTPFPVVSLGNEPWINALQSQPDFILLSDMYSFKKFV